MGYHDMDISDYLIGKGTGAGTLSAELLKLESGLVHQLKTSGTTIAVVTPSDTAWRSTSWYNTLVCNVKPEYEDEQSLIRQEVIMCAASEVLFVPSLDELMSYPFYSLNGCDYSTDTGNELCHTDWEADGGIVDRCVGIQDYKVMNGGDVYITDDVVVPEWLDNMIKEYTDKSPCL